MSVVKLSTVLSALSYALDLTEGQPVGTRGAMPLEQVMKIIQEGRGTQLCPVTVDALFAVTARSTQILPA